MAVSFVAATGGTSSVVVPASVLANDLMLLFVNSTTGVLSTPSGWTQLQALNDGTASNYAYCFMKIAGSTDHGTTVTTSGTGSGLMVYRGATLKQSAGNNSAQSSSFTWNAPSLALPAGGMLAVFFNAYISSSASLPSGWTSRYSRTAVVAGDIATTPSSFAGSSPGNSPWYAITVALQVANTAPNSPTGVAPASGTVDRSIIQRLSWTFSDPDAGDSQSKFDLQWRHAGTSDAWNVVSQTTPNNYWDAPTSTFPAEQIEWQVRTYDQSAAVGPWSALAYFTAADPAAGATIIAPTSGGTVSANPTAVTWSASGQQAYQVRRVADNAGTADPTTVYWDSGQVVDTATRSLSVPFETNNRWEHVQVRVQQGGLWSAWSDVRVNVSYTAPAVPTLTIVTYPDSAAIGVTPVQPAPSGGQPTVTSVDIYRRETAAGGDGERLAAAKPPTAQWIDYTPASGVDYEYLVRAIGNNQTATDSVWTGGVFKVYDGGSAASTGTIILDGGTA